MYNFWFTLTMVLISDSVKNQPFQNMVMLSISPISFEVGVINLVCGCILMMKECFIPFSGYCDFDIRPHF